MVTFPPKFHPRIYLFLSFGWVAWEILVPQLRIEPITSPWKHEVLTTVSKALNSQGSLGFIL